MEASVGEHHDDPGGTILTIALTYMWAANDHLLAMPHLMTARDTGYMSIWAVGRSAIEMLAGAYWLTDPEIDSDERLRRAINERLHSLRGAARLIELADVEEAEIESDPLARAQDLVKRAAQMGYTLTEGTKPQVQPRRPSATELFDALAGPGRYSLFSGMSHGEMWGMSHYQAQAAYYLDTSGLERRMSRSTITVDEYRSVADFMAEKHRGTVLRVMGFMAWPVETYEEAFNRSARAIATPPTA